MGNLINRVLKKKFIDSNVLDREKHVVIGVWNNSDNSNILVNQGIWIGYNNKIFGDKIYRLTFGMKTISSDIVILNFENDIKLKFYKNLSDNKLYFTLSQSQVEYTKELTLDVLQNFHIINNNSQDLDLVYSFINNYNKL